MCRTFRIITYLEYSEINRLIEHFMLDAYVHDNEDGTHDIEISGICDKCLCSVTDKEKMDIYEFIDKVSII